MEGHTAMPISVLVAIVDQSTWMMSSVPQVPASYWSVLADQSSLTTAAILLMLEWVVKVCSVMDPS